VKTQGTLRKLQRAMLKRQASKSRPGRQRGHSAELMRLRYEMFRLLDQYSAEVVCKLMLNRYGLDYVREIVRACTCKS